MSVVLAHELAVPNRASEISHGILDCPLVQLGSVVSVRAV